VPCTRWNTSCSNRPRNRFSIVGVVLASLDGVDMRRMTLELDEHMCEFELVDGRVFRTPVSAGLFGDADPGMRRVSVDIVEQELSLTFPAGDEVTLETGPFDSTEPQRDGRPVVYLDQCHWVTLAQQRWAPEKVAERDRDAAARLIELAEGRRVILPLSGGHLTETTGLLGRHRRHLATTMIGLSGGWQMLNPVVVRGRELSAALAGRDLTVAGVFGLEPYSLFIDGPEMPSGADDLPAPWPETHRRVVYALSIYSTLVEPERLESEEGADMAERWAARHHALALDMRQRGTAKKDIPDVAWAMLLSDLQQEIAEAAMGARVSFADAVKWLENDARNDLASMPYLARHYELIRQRLSNADDRWEGNDLTDINYLACAAGYADVVVGEKKMSEYLRRAEARVPSGANVYRTLPDVVAGLESSS
jgi:hypothetical protein